MKRTYFLITTLFLSILFSCQQERTPLSENTVIVNVQEKSTPISPFIYGQFIEHLGRCIYGGIWAEMLEDRKFFYPVTPDYQPWGSRTDPFWNAGEFKILVASPWKVIGSPEAITMSEKDPFAGQHDPVIALKHENETNGIGQEGLVFEANRKYIGRIYLAASSPGITVNLEIISGDQNPIVIAEFNDLKNDYTRYDFDFIASSDMENAVFNIAGRGLGSFRIGTVSLMPLDNVQGFNHEVLEFLKELDAPIYRWPGGNFVSGYNWKDGIGERDRRPPRKNPAWTGIEPNDVGIHEYMQFCQLLETEPFICVNTGLGTVEEVVEQVEYCNGSVYTPMGKRRTENGNEESFGVKFWAVGNEMYGDWQLGHMPLEEYIKKHNRVAEAMWKVDPAIQLIGVGSVGEWSEAMLSECADHMNYLSEHIYCKDEEVVIKHVRQIPDNIKRVADAHRKYREEIPGLSEKNIRIAMDEWNYWHGDYLYGELGCRYFMKDALGIAAGFHEYFRNSDLFFMANYAQTVNVIGAIKTTKKDVEFATTGMVLKFYRNHFGTIPVSLTGIPDPLDISAALNENGNQLTIAVVNPDSLAIDFNLEIPGIQHKEIVEAWEIANPDPMSYNAPGEERRVDIKSREVGSPGYLKVAPYSITMVQIMLEE
jgi:alpha-N-arabinofuranosidase